MYASMRVQRGVHAASAFEAYHEAEQRANDLGRCQDSVYNRACNLFHTTRVVFVSVMRKHTLTIACIGLTTVKPRGLPVHCVRSCRG